MTTLARLTNPDRIDSGDQILDGVLQTVAVALADTLTPLAEANSLVAEAGLACLQLLSTSWSCRLDDVALLSVVHYTDPEDSWTTGEAASLASRVLDRHLPGTKVADFIAGPLLQTYLRPIFSKSSARVTAAGRPSHFLEPTDRSRPQLEPPSWKRSGLHVVSDFKWAVQASDVRLATPTIVFSS